MSEKLKGWVKKLWPIGTGHFIVLSLLLAVVGVFALRANNLKMVEIREDVFKADQTGENIGEELDELRKYVFSNMNTSTEVELKFTYERAAEEAIKENNNVTSNGSVFDSLPAECGNQASFVDSTDPCVRNYIDQRIEELGGENPRPTQFPNKQLFIYKFEAPLFSFDFAGWTLLLSGIFALIAAGRALWHFVRNEVNFYKGEIEGL